MKTLEVRRHSFTKKGEPRTSGSLLSREGVRAARSLGDRLPSFDYVLTGPDRRHVETAIALGFAVDEMIDWPSGYVSGVVEHHDQWSWERPFSQYAELLRSESELRAVVDVHLEHWRRGVDAVGEGGAVLVVSSGGSIEPVLVAAFPRGEFESWGIALSHLDGATLIFDGRDCVDVTIRRRS